MTRLFASTLLLVAFVLAGCAGGGQVVRTEPPEPAIPEAPAKPQEEVPQ